MENQLNNLISNTLKARPTTSTALTTFGTRRSCWRRPRRRRRMSSDPPLSSWRRRKRKWSRRKRRTRSWRPMEPRRRLPPLLMAEAEVTAAGRRRGRRRPRSYRHRSYSHSGQSLREKKAKSQTIIRHSTTQEAAIPSPARRKRIDRQYCGPAATRHFPHFVCPFSNWFFEFIIYTGDAGKSLRRQSIKKIQRKKNRGIQTKKKSGNENVVFVRFAF